MNRLERMAVERVVQAAVDGTAAEVGPGELSPLHLMPRAGVAEGAGVARAVRPGRPRRVVSRPVAAIGAGAAVLAVAAASFGAASALRADRAEMTGTRTRPAAGPLSLIPRYFVQLDRGPTGQKSAHRVLVIDSTTGKVVASESVPKPFGEFTAVTAAADDRTFVLGADNLVKGKNGRFPRPRVELLALRITPHQSGRVSVTMREVGLRVPVNWVGQGLALSPDGTKLAFAASPFTQAVRTRIWVYSMVTGTTRSWQDHDEVGSAPWDARSLSWASDDKTLAYLWHGNGQVNLLNTNSPGGGLLGHSRKLITFTSRHYPGFDADLTPDGTKVIVSTPTRTVPGRIDEFSAVTGRLIATKIPAALSEQGLGVYDVLWTNSSGSIMILDTWSTSSARSPYLARLLYGNKLILIKGRRSTRVASDLAW